MSYRREITTLGRGGSDTTAVALAAALGAERCEIYSDVDGVYSADPRVVDQPAHLPSIDLATLQEMAEAGAKVINAQAVEWATKSKIAIFARKASDVHTADGAARETVARADSTARVRAVVGLANVVFVRASSSVARLASVAAELDLPVIDLAGDDVGACAVIPLLNVPDWQARSSALSSRIERLEVASGQAFVSIVGAELAGATPKMLAALAEAGAKPLHVSAGPLRVSAVIDGERLDAAQRTLHAAFVHG